VISPIFLAQSLGESVHAELGHVVDAVAFHATRPAMELMLTMSAT
jgi:hypothetical protein